MPAAIECVDERVGSIELPHHHECLDRDGEVTEALTSVFGVTSNAARSGAAG